MKIESLKPKPRKFRRRIFRIQGGEGIEGLETGKGGSENMKPIKFMSAEEKKAVLTDWQIFIKSDFDRKYFTKRLYEHLHLHCSFIANFTFMASMPLTSITRNGR